MNPRSLELKVGENLGLNTGKRRYHYSTCALALLALSLVLPGCNVIRVFLPGKAKISIDQDANSGSLGRSTGDQLFVRLKEIWPDLNNSGVEYGFSGPGSSGLLAVISGDSRTTDPLSQIVFRDWISNACRATQTPSASYAFGGAKKIWEIDPDDVLMSSESLPTDEAQRIAFVTARKVWLYPYAVNSPEVQQLAQLYRDLLNVPEGGDKKLEAEVGVCIAAFMAPQFWIGNPGPEDMIRRVALHLGRRVPDFDEFEEFRSGRLTIERYARRIQSEEGYKVAVKTWHQESLGLRPFDGSIVDRNEMIRDYREAGGSSASAFQVWMGSGPDPWGYKFYKKSFLRLGGLLGGVRTLADVGEYNDDSSWCVSADVVNAPDEQAFDPRTTMILWEHFLPTKNRWETVGAWVRDGFQAQYRNEVVVANGSLGGADSFNTLCKRYDDSMSDGLWHQCAGRMTNPLSQTGWTQTGVEDITEASPSTENIEGDATYAYTTDPYDIEDQKGAKSKHVNQLAGVRLSYDSVPSGRFKYLHRRVRRFSPRGEQDGVSSLKLWYSERPTRVCNTVSRFHLSCSYRAGAAELYQDDGLPWNGSLRSFKHSYVAYSLMHPTALAQVRCGQPNPSAMDEENGYPKGYSSLSANEQVQVNQTQTSGFFVGFSGGHGENLSFDVDYPEGQAIVRLSTDLQNEAYNLIDYIISRPEGEDDYSLLVTADFTFARKEYELMLKSQGRYLPAYPPGYTPISQGGGSFTQTHWASPLRGRGAGGISIPPLPFLHRINASEMKPIPINWIQNALPAIKDHWLGAQRSIYRPCSGAITSRDKNDLAEPACRRQSSCPQRRFRAC